MNSLTSLSLLTPRLPVPALLMWEVQDAIICLHRDLRYLDQVCSEDISVLLT